MTAIRIHTTLVSTTIELPELAPLLFDHTRGVLAGGPDGPIEDDEPSFP